MQKPCIKYQLSLAFVQNKGFAIINTNQQLSIPKKVLILMKGQLSIKLCRVFVYKPYTES